MRARGECRPVYNGARLRGEIDTFKDGFDMAVTIMPQMK